MKKKSSYKMASIAIVFLLVAIMLGAGIAPVSARVPGHIEYNPSYYKSVRLYHRITTGVVVIWGIIILDVFYNGQTGLIHVTDVWFYTSVDSWTAIEIKLVNWIPVPFPTYGEVKTVKMRCYIGGQLVHSYNVHTSSTYIRDVHKEHEYYYRPSSELTSISAKIEVSYDCREYGLVPLIPIPLYMWHYASGTMSTTTGAYVVWD
ncbi:MAG: hypothetical protein EAX86_12420 [Candidatus Heimdallarchaeota archaeon]|nr:hypothetical protein [Candidatus Heimdallarchaeota archaeon]